MYLRQLQYFVAVARSSSFMAASRVMHVSQPALSFQIKQLEAALGTELLSRHSRGVLVTEAGAVFLERAEEILRLVRDAEIVLARFRKRVAGNVVIGVTPTAGRALTPDLLDISRRDTDLRINLRQGMSNELLSATRAGEVDLSLCYDPPVTERLRAVPLYCEELFLVGPPLPDGACGDEIGFAEMIELPLVLDNRFQSIRQLLETVAATKRLKLPAGIEIEPVNLKREMIVHHRHCTVVPYGLFGDELRRGDLGARRIRDPYLTRTMNLVFSPQLPPQIETFLLAAVRAIVRSKIEQGEFGWTPVASPEAAQPLPERVGN